MIRRFLQLPETNEYSFFLWGSRQTGKSTLLRQTYKNCLKIDLLQTDQYVTYLNNPSHFREVVLASSKDKRVVVDEIQLLPLLLNEIHFLIEEHGYCFALSGSSARKVKRGQANLLGGRAVKFELFGVTFNELVKTEIYTAANAREKLLEFVNKGNLPSHISLQNSTLFLKSYVEDYLKEEIAAEALVRNVASFSEFLRIAAVADTEFVQYTNIARECGVSSPTVKEHYQILCDTLLGSFVSPFLLQPKRTTMLMQKFYFKNVGIVNFLAKRGTLSYGGELFGKAFENIVYHELSAYLSYTQKFEEITYWRTKSGIEVDFIVGAALCAIEVKGAEFVDARHLKGLRSFKEEYPQTKKLICVSIVNQNRRTEDGIDILSFESFVQKLWGSELL